MSGNERMSWLSVRETRPLSAALAAREQGARVLGLERAPESERGGNSRFTGGAIRFVYNGLDDLRQVMPELSDDEIAMTDFGTYTRDDFFADMERITQFRSDPDMAALLIDRSLETLIWLRSHGVRFVPSYQRQAFKVDGKFKFWGGLAVDASGGGPGLMDSMFAAAERAGIEIRYETRVDRADWKTMGSSRAVRVRRHGKVEEIPGQGGRAGLRWV